MRIRSTRSRLRPRIVIATIAAAATLTVSGCSAQSAKPSPSSSELSNQSITIPATSAPQSLDPAQLAGGQQAYVWNSVYDTLLYQNNKGDIEPNAATSWSYSKNGLNLTLKLRKGMTFSNGDKVDSAAVKATLERTMKTPGPQQGKLAPVKSISDPDPLTVIIHLKAPKGSLVEQLATGLGVIGDPATLNTKRTALNPVGSGPYTLDTAATVAGTTYVLHRRSHYWNEKAYPFKTVTVKVIADPTADLNALQSGEIDAAIVQPNDLPRVSGAGFTTTAIKKYSSLALYLADRDGTVVKPLADIRVRKAINMAFDRPKIVKKLLSGLGAPTEQMADPLRSAYVPSLNKTYPYDPSAAKKLLAEAGYPHGFNVTMPGIFYIQPDEATVTQALADIGIKVTWAPIPPSNTAAAISSKKYGMFLYPSGLNTPATDADALVNPEGFYNPFGSQNPKLTKLYTQANSETDPVKAAVLYKKMNTFLVKNAWLAPIYYAGVDWVSKKGITVLAKGAVLPSIRNFGVGN